MRRVGATGGSGLLAEPEFRGSGYQQVSEGFFKLAALEPGSVSQRMQSYLGEPHQAPTSRMSGRYDKRVSETRTPAAGDRAQRAREALRLLTELKRKAQQKSDNELEMRWLAKNRDRYAGRWIALQGRNLLACGDTAKEVFSKVSDTPTPPLVIRVDTGDQPFGGW